MALAQPPCAWIHLRFVPRARCRLANVCRSPWGVNLRPSPNAARTAGRKILT